MTINYESKIGKRLKDSRTIRKEFGQLSLAISMRLDILSVAETLNDVPNVPPTRRHKLSGDYQGCWGIDVSKNYRMVIRPDNGDGTPESVTQITIVDIVDYH